MMSKYRKLFKAILLSTLLLTLFAGLLACKKAPETTAPLATTNTPAAKTTASPLTVLSITGGDVLIMKPGDREWSRSDVGMTLGIDFKIKTGAGGKASITFFEGSVIELAENTEITLADLGLADTTTTIKLKQKVGDTISRVKKLSNPASAYEIETPASVTAVRGTTVYNSVAINGTTVVGNIDGSVVVITRGIETPVSAGKHVTIKPGELPGKEEPGAIPEPTPPPTTIAPPPTTTPTTTVPPTTLPPPVISIISALNQQKVFNGDTVTIAYTVSNTGAVPVSGVTLSDDKAGPAVLVSGDSNGNLILDPNETWLFNAHYAIPAGASGVLSTTATISGKSPDNKTVSKSVLTQIVVTTLMIQITSPNANTVVTEVITLAGTVNDPSVTQVTINQNGAVSVLSAANGSFSTSITLMSGVNIITVTATRAGGATATARLDLQPVEDTPR
jgi:hypothetical protein